MRIDDFEGFVGIWVGSGGLAQLKIFSEMERLSCGGRRVRVMEGALVGIYLLCAWVRNCTVIVQ